MNVLGKISCAPHRRKRVKLLTGRYLLTSGRINVRFRGNIFKKTLFATRLEIFKLRKYVLAAETCGVASIRAIATGDPRTGSGTALKAESWLLPRYEPLGSLDGFCDGGGNFRALARV
jgi:hypothetical protein